MVPELAYIIEYIEYKIYTDINVTHRIEENIRHINNTLVKNIICIYSLYRSMRI